MIKVVTTFHPEGLTLYGQRFIDSFSKNVDKDIKLIVYAEHCEPNNPDSNQIKIVSQNNITKLTNFKNKWKDVPKANGKCPWPEKRPRDHHKEFKWDAVRFANKVYAVFHAEENLPARLHQVNDGHLADLVIVCTGATSAIHQALQSVERGGTILFFASTAPDVTIPISINDLFWRTDITLTTSYAGSPDDYAAALELIQARRVPICKMITHRVGLEETGLGFQLVAEAQNSIKVIIEPQR